MPHESQELLTVDLHANTVGEYNLDFTRLLYMLYMDIENQITRVDGKAQLVLSTNAILGAVVASFGVKPGLVERIQTDTLAIASVAAYICFFLALLGSVAFALLAAFPNLGQRWLLAPRAQTSAPMQNLFNSAHIAALTRDEYEGRFLDLTLQGVKQDVVRQIHAKSLVVQSKYRWMQISLRFLMTGLFLLAVASMLQLVLAA